MSSLWKIRSSKGMPVIVLPCPKLCKWIQSVSDLKRALRLSGGKECFIFESWLELFRPCHARPRPFLFSLQPKKEQQSSKEYQTNFQCLNCSQDMVCYHKMPGTLRRKEHSVMPSASCSAFDAFCLARFVRRCFGWRFTNTSSLSAECTHRTVRMEPSQNIG